MYLRLLSILTVLLLLNACEAGQQRGQKPDGNPAFHTTAPSLLYFKNMRSSYYKMEEQPGSRIEFYQLSRFENTQSRPILYPIIANNWLQDEAYLFLEKNNYEKGFAEPLKLKWRIEKSESGNEKLARTSESEDGPEVVKELSPATTQNQYELALAIYQALRSQKEIQVQDAEGNWQPIFENKQDRQHYLTTVRDYLRLTEAK